MMQPEVIKLACSKTYAIKTDQFGIKFCGEFEWYKCRELFHRIFDLWYKGFFYSVEPKACEEMMDFINIIENKLNLVERTLFYPTNRAGVIYIKPAKFWLRNHMRSSLFSILVRDGAIHHYIGQDINETFKHSEYLAQTLEAIQHFLEGNTWYTGSETGWVKAFQYSGSRRSFFAPAANNERTYTANRYLSKRWSPWVTFGRIIRLFKKLS